MMANIASQLLSRQAEPDEERLLKLFSNRSELKREVDKLRRDGHQLKEKLQQQEGAAIRFQQRLEQLEGMLSEPTQAANAAVFYQLRGIWHSCRRRLSRLASDLTTRKSEREHRKTLELFEDARNKAMAILDDQIAIAKQSENRIEETVAQLDDRTHALRGFWNYFKRRALQRESEPLRASLNVAAGQAKRLEMAKVEKSMELAPEFEGLSVIGKRKVNLALIAIAQEFFLHFHDRNIGVMAREASVRNAADVSYGDIKECRKMNGHIEKLLRTLPVADDLIKQVRQRSQHLSRHASYRLDSDSVPIADSVAEIALRLTNDDYPSSQNKSVAVNVLVDEYWDIYTLLLT